MATQLLRSIDRLDSWLVKNDYKGYDPFDGLNSQLLRPFTFNNKILRIALQQGVRRFPLNVRPMLGISKSRSSKGMGFIARGYMRLVRASGDSRFEERAVAALQWLMDNQCTGYSGSCWGNHFDYQSRVFYLPRGVPTVVWGSLIGHAFLDAYHVFSEDRYLAVAISSCEHIMKDLGTHIDGDEVCISYIPTENKQVHNANTLAASLLARTGSLVDNRAYIDLASKAIGYTVKYQREDGSWFYGEANNLRWIDNFHTAYVLDSLKHYIDSTGDPRHVGALKKGYEYWKRNLFLTDGTPKYYNTKVMPIDIQCSAQAIDTLVFFHDRDDESHLLAKKVAQWTIENMQDRSGYFYYRRYRHGIVNRTPTLHWGQATMLCALGGLYQLLKGT